MPWLRRLVTGLSSLGLRFDPRWVMDNLTLLQVCLRVRYFLFSQVTFIFSYENNIREQTGNFQTKLCSRVSGSTGQSSKLMLLRVSVAETVVRSRASPREICPGRSGTRTRPLPPPVNRHSLLSITPPICHTRLHLNAGLIGRTSGRHLKTMK